MPRETAAQKKDRLAREAAEENVVQLRPESLPESPSTEPPAPPVPAHPDLDAVLIVKTTDAQGNIQTDVGTQGNVQATEVQTLIELGLQSWRAKIGLR